MKTITADKLKNFKPSIKQSETFAKLLIAKAEENVIRPIVLKIQNDILKKYNWEVAEENMKYCDNDEIVVSSPDDAYLLSEKDSDIYYKECRQGAVNKGIETLNPLYCPLLVAENNTRKCKRVFTDAMAELTSVTADEVLSTKNSLENYKNLVKINTQIMSQFL